MSPRKITTRCSARAPPKRVLQRTIETKLARALLKGAVQEGSQITFTIQGDEMAFQQQPVWVA